MRLSVQWYRFNPGQNGDGQNDPMRQFLYCYFIGKEAFNLRNVLITHCYNKGTETATRGVL